MNVKSIPIRWQPGMSIFACESFLKAVGDEYGWLGGMSETGELLCILPYTLIRKMFLRMVRFRTETIFVSEKLEIPEEKKFLEEAMGFFRTRGADLIIPASNNAIFRTYPDGGDAAPYGSYIIDLNKTEDMLWKNIDRITRQNIKTAQKNGVQIVTDFDRLNDVHRHVRDTFRRSKLPFMNLESFKRYVKGLGSNGIILAAVHNGAVQSCVVFAFSEYCAYAIYAGNSSDQYPGANKLLYWEAIRLFRSMGVRQYDFMGARIDPEKGSKQEALAQFKKRFGAELKRGFIWKYPLHPVRYRLYALAARLRSGGDIVDAERHKLIPPPLREANGAEDSPMPGLMPVELWDYRWVDIFRGLTALFGASDSNEPFSIPGLGRCIPTRSARIAIMAALQALRLKPGARIGVPLYCCPVVFKAIRSVGYTACFIDCGSRTACISPEDLAKKSPRIEALIAVHLFGNTCEMSLLKDAMNGKPIIEDCAQSLGSRFEDGRPSGSAGEIAVFSFRFGKYLSAGEGGALYSSRAEIQDRLRQIVVADPAPSRAKEVAHLADNFLRAKLRSKPLWGFAGYRIWGFYNQNVDFASKSPINLSQGFRSDLNLIRRRLEGLDAEVKLQRKIAAYYKDSLQVDASMLGPESPGAYSNRYIFPIIFPSTESRDRMAAYLFGRRIGTATPYADVVAGAAKNYGYEGDCPATERLLARTLVIPTHYRLKKREQDDVVRCFNEGWSKIKPST